MASLLLAQGVGVLIERYKVDQQAAFNFPVRLSSHSNTKFREVTARVVADAVSVSQQGK